MRGFSFLRSIHTKFILIYVLLILVAMQIMGVYFFQQLERRLTDNFTESINERMNLLYYNLEQAFSKERKKEDPSLEADIQTLMRDFISEDLNEVQVIDKSGRVIGTSNSENQDIIGKRTTQLLVKRALVVGTKQEKESIDEKSGDKMRIMVVPIKVNNETVGAIYLLASMEDIYDQMRDINRIFMTGTAIALGVTALLGILLARTITRPIVEMRKQAIEMAKGNFSRKVKVYGNDEIGQLSETFNNLSLKLLQARATTEGEKRKLSSVLTHMTDGVIATDRKGRIILLNHPASEMLNVSRETALDKPVLEVLGLEEQYSMENLFDEPEDVLLDFSTRNKPYIIRASFSVVQKDTGKVNGLIVVLYDVTEQEKIEQERREFVANVSHELRTPLTTMRSYLEALSDGAWQDEKLAPQFLQVTQDETERMIRLVTDLLQLSKLDSTEYHLMKDWVNFTTFFNKIIDRFEMSKQQNVTFQRSFSKKPHYVELDEDKITQVIYNIISNAMKYSPEGGKITYRMREKDDFLLVSISDEGVGIPKENIGKIFDRFYRVDKARTRKLGGTGLGLAIAKEMIQAHGGKIWAESQEGKGTTIYFTLPLEQDQGDDWE
ncbi:MAG: cell wall metabolism sensor histidine kinase WalK [Bacillaceae bacterium]